MATTPSQRVFAWISIVLAVIVLVLSAAGIIGTWVVGNRVSTSAVELMVGVEKIAGAGRTSIGNIRTNVGDIRSQVTAVQDATTKLSQNVNDKGLVMSLLPPEKEQELQSRVDTFNAKFAGIRETLEAAVELYRSINRLPFVKLPQPDKAKLENLATWVDNLDQTIQEIRTQVAAVRAGASDAIGKVTAAVERANERLSNIDTELGNIDGQLATVQDTSRGLQRLIPIVYVVSSIVITLFLAWVIYSQVVVIRAARAKLRGPAA